MSTLATTAKSLLKLLPKTQEPTLRLLIGLGEQSWTPAQQQLVWDRLKANECTLELTGHKLPKQPAPPMVLPQQAQFVDFQNNTFVLKLDEDNAHIICSFDIHKLKQDRKTELWTVPYRMSPVLELHKAIKAMLEEDPASLYVTDAAKAAVTDMYKEMRERYHASKAADADLDLTGFGLLDPQQCAKFRVNPGIFPYQRAGIKGAARFKRGWIADDMGLGKTRQALGVLFVLQCFPALIVCPNSVVLNWVREASAAFPGRKFWYAKSKQAPKHTCKLGSQQMSLFADEQQLIYDANCDYCQLLEADVVVYNYHKVADGWKEGRDEKGNKIKGWKKQKGERVQVQLSEVSIAIGAKKFNSFFADECHYLKNNATQWTKGVKELVKGIAVRLLLSGTPIKNRPNELESQAEILDRMDDLGGWHLFHKKFCNMKTDGSKPMDTSGSSNESELNKMLRAVGFIQRSKRDPKIQLDLPPLTETELEVEIDNQDEYIYAEKKTIEWCAEQAVKKKEFLELLAAYSDPTDITAAIERKKIETRLRTMRAEAIIRIGALRKVAALGKLSAAKEWITDFNETGEKLVIFAHHTEVTDAIQEKFKTLYIAGKHTQAERQEAIDLFQNDQKFKHITISSAAREGVTLTAASYMLFLERQWTPADESQIIGRIERIGAKHPMFVYRMLGLLKDGKETIDHRMHRLLAKKKHLCDLVIKGEMTQEEADEFDVAEELMGELAGL